MAGRDPVTAVDFHGKLFLSWNGGTTCSEEVPRYRIIQLTQRREDDMKRPLNGQPTRRLISRTAAIGAGLLLLPALAACSNDTAGPEADVDVEDVLEGNEEVLEEPNPGRYEDIYDKEFFDSITNYIDTDVTLSARVNAILSEQALTITGTDDATVDPLLIIHKDPAFGLEEDIAVQVTGRPYSRLLIGELEDRLGIDLNDELLADWEGQPYVEATVIDTSPEFAGDGEE